MILSQNEDGWFVNVNDETGERVGTLTNTHDPRACASKGCAVHNRPSAHALDSAPLNWRTDRGILERICKHGVGHPDYDASLYLQSIGMDSENVHGCDGCCGPNK